jgi:hypothetical protein
VIENVQNIGNDIWEGHRVKRHMMYVDMAGEEWRMKHHMIFEGNFLLMDKNLES